MALFCWFLLLTLIVGLSQPEVQAEDEDNTSEEEFVDDTEDTLILTKYICLDGHNSAYVSSQCCQIFTELDHQTEYCLSKSVKVSAKDEVEKLVKYSKLTECIYSKKKYIKNDRSLNMGRIKADVAKLHNPLAEKYTLKAYRDCGRQATRELNNMEEQIKKTAKARHAQLALRKPFFLLVHRCILKYSSTHQCPYFRWNSINDEMSAKCKNYTQNCKKILEIN